MYFIVVYAAIVMVPVILKKKVVTGAALRVFIPIEKLAGLELLLFK